MCKNELLLFNIKEILQKAKERYSKRDIKSCWVLFTKQRRGKRTCQKKKKTRLKSTKGKDASNCFSKKRSVTK